MRFVLLHYHFPKNAGSTIENILDRNFGERFARIDSPDRSAHFTNAELLSMLESRPELTAISSHQIRHPLPTARGYLFFDICFLRDPIDRIRSMYEYFREKPAAGDLLSELANRSGLGEFLTCLVDRFPEAATNVQVALMAKGGVDEDPPSEQDFKLALERILESAFLGVVDCFEESLVAGRYYLDPVFPNLDCAEEPVNVSGGMDGSLAARRKKVHEACGRGVYAELVRRNTLDCALVRRARAEVRRRLALRPPPLPPPRRSSWRLFPSWRIRRARLFDAAFYLERYADVRVAGMNPLRHYLRYGAAEGRKPHPLFQPDYYLARCPEARNSPNPLLHFFEQGAMCPPHPLFDCSAYVEENPDAAPQPLVHYLRRISQPAPAAGIRIMDVPLTAQIWKDAEGRKQFLAPPQQRPFLRVVGYDQLSAQTAS